MMDQDGPVGLRDEALAALRVMLGQPSVSNEDGEYWYVARRAPGRGGFDVHLNHPADPAVAEVLVMAGAYRVYTVQARTIEDLRLGLRVVEMIVRP